MPPRLRSSCRLLLALLGLSLPAAEVADFARPEAWKADPGTVATARCEASADGLTLSFQDTPGKDVCSYRLACATDIGGMGGLRLRLRMAKTGWLTVAVTIDGVTRVVSPARAGDAQWREIAVPISGKRLDDIRLALDEPAANGLAVSSERIRLDAAWARIERDAPIDEASGADLLGQIADGSFETAQPDGKLGRGWGENQWKSEATDYRVVDDRPHGGKHCQRVHVREAGVMTGISVHKLRLQPGGRYEVKGWLRGQGLKTPRVLLEVAQAEVSWEEKQKRIYLNASLDVGQDWTPFASEFTLPSVPEAYSDVHGIQMTVWMNCHSNLSNTGILWLDDIAITRLPDVTKRPGNLLFNGDLELGVAGWRLGFLDWQHVVPLPQALKKPPTLVADAASGKQAMRIELPYAEGTNVRIDLSSLPFRALPGEQVTLSWYAKTEGGHASGTLDQGLVVRPKSGSGMGEKDVSINGRLTDKWQRFSGTVTLKDDPEGLYHVWMPVQVPPSADKRTTVLWIDGIQVEYGAQATPVTAVAPLTMACMTPEGEPEDHLYLRGQKARVQITSQCEQAATVPWTVIDVWGKPIQEGTLALPAGLGRQLVDLPTPALGAFKISFRPPGSVSAAKPLAEHVYHILPRQAKPAWEPDSPFGMHLWSNDYSMDMASKLGVRWIRLFGAMTWNTLEPKPGVWTTDEARAILARYAERKLLVMPVLTGTPARHALPAEEGASHVPKDDQVLGTWLDVLKSLDGPAIGAWEVWNEPNLGDEFKAPKGVDKKLAYIDFSERMYAQLKARSSKPVANQLTAANFEDGWMADMLGRGFAAHADVISYHNYLSQNDPLEIGLDKLFGEWNALMTKTGRVVPLEMSEGGICGTGAVASWYERMPKYVHGTVLDEAGLNVRTMVANLGLGVKRVFLYHAYGDSPRWGETGTTDFWGAFLEGDGVPKPSCTAYAVMTWQLEGKPFAKKLRPSDRTWCHVFRGSSGAVAVCWSDDGEAKPVTVPLAATGALDLMGNPLPIAADGAGTTISLDRNPVYLQLR